jgi:hypothetical protein
MQWTRDSRVLDCATDEWLGTWMLVHWLPPTETLRELVGAPNHVEFLTVKCLGIKVDKLPFICFVRALICLLKRIILEVCWFIDHPVWSDIVSCPCLIDRSSLGVLYDDPDMPRICDSAVGVEVWKTTGDIRFILEQYKMINCWWL